MWCEDQARLGLKPVARRVRAAAGARPTSNGRHEFASPFVYGFARPKSGRSRFVVLPKANTEHMGRAPADFASSADPDGRKVSVLVVDNAGGHIAEEPAVPSNVRLRHLPSCTPGRQPAEHLWPLGREGLANRVFDELSGTTETLVTRCQWPAEHTDVVAGAVGSRWAVAA